MEENRRERCTKIGILAFVCLIASCLHTPKIDGFKLITQPTRIHRIRVSHPEFGKGIEAELTEVIGDNGKLGSYFMVVDSVVCGDKQCQVVPVRLWWDAIGQFTDYELRPGENLTKRGHRPFSSSAHMKLKSILKDSNSPLGKMKMSALAGPSKWTKKGDGISGATPATIKKIVVPGAAYTCFTLWHWANGSVVKVIRERTGMKCRKETLLKYLSSRTEVKVAFALEYLKKRRIHDDSVIAAAVKAAQTGDRQLVDPTLTYLKQATPNDYAYCNAIIDIFEKTETEKRILILETMADWKKGPPPKCLDRLGGCLDKLEAYFEIHLLLRLMEKRKYSSPKVIGEVAKLLKHDNFFIGRRALRFLKKQKLPKDVQRQVKAFEERYGGRF